MVLSEPLPATASDGLEIAKVHVISTQDSSHTRLMNGSVTPETLIPIIGINLSGDIGRQFSRYLVIKDLENGAIVSYVKWVIPHTLEEGKEEQQRFKAGWKGPKRPQGLNEEMSQEFMEKIEIMRKEVLGEPARPHYFCGNLATLPTYRRQGAASKLMRWPFEQADEERVAVYLDTDQNGPAISGYKSLGFIQVGQPLEIDLEKYGGVGTHRHVAMIREPQNKK